MPNSENELHIDYKARINRVFQYIEDNLDEQLSLQELAKIAHFSPFHFHRVFKLITSETLNEYVIRQRIEKSASVLLHRKNQSISEVADLHGFSNNTVFSRAFKQFYGVSPSEFQKQNLMKSSKIRQLNSKNCTPHPSREEYLCTIDHLKKWLNMSAQIEIRTLPTIHLAFMNSIGELNLQNTYQKLLRWATPKGLLDKADTKVITIYHNSFKITAPNKVRMSACISTDMEFVPEGEVGKMSIEGGKHIVGYFEITPKEFEKAWTGMFLWMNEKGYKKADKNPFEIYLNNFNEHPEGIAFVELCIPIEEG